LGKTSTWIGETLLHLLCLSQYIATGNRIDPLQVHVYQKQSLVLISSMFLVS